MDEIDIEDVATESRIVGCFYKNPDLFMEYDSLIFADWDFINGDLRFLYNLIREIWGKGLTNIDETTINIEVNKDEEKQKYYKKLHGYKTIQRLMSKANLEDFEKYYRELKKYNLLRALDRKGFPVRAKWDKIINLDPEAIYGYFDYHLNKTFTYYEGIESSVILGKDIVNVYEKWKETPDIGIEVFYYIVGQLIRGWRIHKLNATGLHSGAGKSRYISLIAMGIGIVLQTPILIIVNEQDKEEWDSLLITAVVNNIFAPKTGIYVDEDKIITGQCNEKEDKVCKEAAQYIQERSKIYFQEAQIYDYQSLKRVLKVHKMKGVNFFIYDTFKPFRGNSGATWEMFVKTSEELKNICGSKKKGGLDMAGWITFQLTDDSQFDTILTSSSVASGKQIKHNLDYMSLGRVLSYKEKKKIQVKILQKDNPFNGDIVDLDPKKEYYIFFNDKNRGGKDKQKIIYEVDKGKIIFKELGFAVFKKKEDEDSVENRNIKK